jgi:hypothetical protein
MVEVLIYGASDDLVEVEGAIEGADEFNVHGKWKRRLVSPEGESLIIRAEFSPVGSDAEWLLSVENTSTYPDWPIRFTERPDREGDPALLIEVPQGTVLRKIGK